MSFLGTLLKIDWNLQSKKQHSLKGVYASSEVE